MSQQHFIAPKAGAPAQRLVDPPSGDLRDARFDTDADIVERLPDVGRATLRNLRNDASAARAAVVDALDMKHAIADELHDNMRRLTAHIAAGGDEKHSEHGRLSRARARIEAELQRAEELCTARAPRQRESAAAVAAVTEYVSALPAGFEIAAFRGVLPTLRKGEGPADAVARCRKAIGDLEAARVAVEKAPWPSSLVIAKAHAEIDKMAELGRPVVSGAVGSGLPVRWPDSAHSQFRGPHAAFLEISPAILFAAWLHRDALKKAIQAEILQRADDAKALTSEQRALRLKELATERLLTEREEEAAVKNSGGAILRRATADPRAVLGIEGPEPKGQFG